ncbi:hypothetical protein Tco_1345481 [Tanacetum coccineum]
MSTLIPSHGESSGGLMRSCIMEVLHESSYTDTMDSLCSRAIDAEAPLEDQLYCLMPHLQFVARLCGTTRIRMRNPEEDTDEDHADYPADGGDDDDEPSDDDDDDTDDGMRSPLRTRMMTGRRRST